MNTSDNPKSPKADFEKLLKSAKEAPKSKRINKPAKKPTTNEPSIVPIPDSINVIGETADGKIVVESLVNRKIYIIPIRDLSYEQILQIGGSEVAKDFYRSVNRQQSEQKYPILALRENLILEAAKTQIGSVRWIGQGIHHLKKTNQTIVVNGGRAYRLDGCSLSNYTNPRVGLRLIEKDAGRRWINIDKLQQVLRKIDTDMAFAIKGDLLSLFSQWGFQGQLDVQLLVGWFLAQIVQTSWSWRMHLWVTGAQSTGKSLLVECLATLGGRLSLKLEGQTQTEPGLRQAIGSNACLVIIDEAERTNRQREAVIQLLRSGRSGTIVKGSSTQKATFFDFKHMVCLASIETGLDRAAEISRFFVVEMAKESARSPILPSVADTERLRPQIFGYALWSIDQVKCLIAKPIKYKNVDSRLVDSYKLPAAMLAVAHRNAEEQFQEYLEMFLTDWSLRRSHEIEEDELQLLNAVMTSTIRVSIPDETIGIGGSYGAQYADRSISQLIGNEISNNGDGPGIYAGTLAANGIKLCNDGIFINPSTVGRKLLSDTTWRGFNVATVLKRLPGVKRKQRRLVDGAPAWGLLIPRKTCFPDEDVPF